MFNTNHSFRSHSRYFRSQMALLSSTSLVAGRWRYMLSAPRVVGSSSFSLPNTAFCIFVTYGVILQTKSLMQLFSSSVWSLIMSSNMSGRDSFLAAVIISCSFREFLLSIHCVVSSNRYCWFGLFGPARNVEIWKEHTNLRLDNFGVKQAKQNSSMRWCLFVCIIV